MLLPVLLLGLGGCASHGGSPAGAVVAGSQGAVGVVEAQPVAMRSGEPIARSQGDPYEQGKAHLRHGRYGLALEEFRRALMREGQNVRILNAMAITYDELGRFDLSSRHYRAALALEPDSPSTLNNLGRSLLRQGRAEQALAVLQRARPDGTARAAVDRNVGLARQALARAGAMGRGVAAIPAGTIAPEDATGPRLVRTSLNEHALRTDPARRPALRPAALGAVRAPIAANASGRARIEVGNGTGRQRMASRMAHHLREQGLEVNRLFNADHYGYRTSRILFRAGFEGAARRLRELLPIEVAMEESDEPVRDVRLLLGADLLQFDATVLAGVPR